MSEMM